MRSKALLVLALLLGTAGVGLLIYQPVMNHLIVPRQLNQEHQAAFEYASNDQIEHNLVKLHNDDDPNNNSFDFDSVENWSVLSVNPTIDKEKIIGEIYIPSVSLHLPILYGSTNKNLKAAAGSMKPDQKMGEGNYALAGHNSRNPKVLFAPIRNINEGDRMYLTDKKKVYVYEMINNEVVLPHRVDVIEDVPDQSLLTLVSCFSSDGSDRIIVTGQLMQVMDYDEQNFQRLS